jgi:hypothetical protein
MVCSDGRTICVEAVATFNFSTRGIEAEFQNMNVLHKPVACMSVPKPFIDCPICQVATC